MKIFIGADHKGFELKKEIKEWLSSANYQVEDLGAFEYKPGDDYVDFATSVANKVTSEKGSRGIVICGSGAGVDITANKTRGIRCCLGFNIEQVKAARNDDDINVLALASDYCELEKAKKLTDAFLNTDFDPTENHVRRIEKIKNLES
jgi:ribose 5-phosphate isomerase B